MMETTAIINSMARGMGGELLVTLSMPPVKVEEVNKLMNENLTVKIDKFRNKRSVNANNYSWVLISKIAEKMYPPMSKEDTYLEMLKRYGQGTTISVQTDKLPDVCRELDYWEEIGKGTVNGKAFTHLRMWVGSSKYDTKEMSIFIDGIVEEAQELGIETLTPDELSRMVGEWNT
jgi:hypothetical protein